MTQMHDTNIRNRQIKKLLSRAFPGIKVTVRASYAGSGNARAHIDFTPFDRDQSNELVSLCWDLIKAAKIEVGTHYTDDMCDTRTPDVRIEFNWPRYYLTMKHEDGTMSVMREYCGEWERA